MIERINELFSNCFLICSNETYLHSMKEDEEQLINCFIT